MRHDVDGLAIFIANHQSAAQLTLFAITLCGLWAVEARIAPISISEKWRHAKLNVFLVTTALPIQLIFNVMLASLIYYEESSRIITVTKLLRISSPWTECLFLFGLFDFLDYAYHRAMHHVPFLWRFHLVHHTDQIMDVSTTLREHPGETLVRNGFLVTVIMISGASVEALLMRQTIQTFTNIMAHTSLCLPPRAARIVGWIFITPNLHHVHHHYKLPFTNCNYGDTFSIWDRIFGTFAAPTGQNSQFGLQTHGIENVNGLGLIGMPYKKVVFSSETPEAAE